MDVNNLKDTRDRVHVQVCKDLQNVWILAECDRTLFRLPTYPSVGIKSKRSSLMNGYHPLSFKVQYCRVALALKWSGGKILLFFFAFLFFFLLFFSFFSFLVSLFVRRFPLMVTTTIGEAWWRLSMKIGLFYKNKIESDEHLNMLTCTCEYLSNCAWDGLRKWSGSIILIDLRLYRLRL